MKSLSEIIVEGRNQLERPVDVPDNANVLFIDVTSGNLTFYQGVDAVISMMKDDGDMWEESELADVKKALAKNGGSIQLGGGDYTILRFG